MQKLKLLLAILLMFFIFPTPVFAQETSPEIVNFTNSTLQIITLISAAAAVFFLIKSGYTYITSTGKPDALESAKNTFRNALIGLVLVLSANVVVSVFKSSLNPTELSSNQQAVEIININTAEPSEGLTQVLIDAIGGFIQNIVESATEPIVNGVIGFLTTTPSLLNNSVIKNFWLVSVGIVDTLFVLVIALTGLQVMSATTFGFDEVDLKQILPRLGLSFLAANTSLFLFDYVVVASNALVKGVLDSTGGLNRAFIVDAINPSTFISGSTPMVILIFLVLFLIVTIVLLLMYISRLIFIALGAVLSPFIFLLWSMPRFSDFASIAFKTYFVSVFIVFVHVVIIQLAGSFLALPDHSENSLVSIAVAIGLFFTLLKTPSLMMQMIMYTSNNGTFRKLGTQIINVMSTDQASNTAKASQTKEAVKTPRKVVNA
jgi:hypothetical protein